MEVTHGQIGFFHAQVMLKDHELFQFKCIYSQSDSVQINLLWIVFEQLVAVCTRQN